MATDRRAADRSTAVLRAALEPFADPERAAAMSAYMKSHGESLGIGAPDRRIAGSPARRLAARPVLAECRGAPEPELLEVAAGWWR